MYEFDARTFASVLFRTRVRLGWTQVYLAELAMVSRSAIANWENRVSVPNSQNLRKLITVLDRNSVDFADETRRFLEEQEQRNVFQDGINRRIYQALGRAGFSLQQLASRAGTNVTHVTRSLSNIQNERILERIAAELDVPAKWVLNGPDNTIPSQSRSYINVIRDNGDFDLDIGSIAFSLDFLRYPKDSNIDVVMSRKNKSTDRLLARLPSISIFKQDKNAVVIHDADSVAYNDDIIELRLKNGQKDRVLPPEMSDRLLKRLGIDPLDEDGWEIVPGDLEGALEAIEGRVDTDASDPLSQRPAAYQFGYRNGKIVAAAVGSARSSDIGEELRAEIARKAHQLRARLKNTQVPSHVLDTIDRVIDALSDNFESIRPGILLSRVRALSAVRASYDSPEGRMELFPDAQAMVADLGNTLGDLLATFPELLELESQRLSLELTSEKSPDALRAALSITEAAASFEIVDDSAVQALTMTVPDISETDRIIELTTDDQAKADAYELRSKLIAQRLLDIRNFSAKAISAASELGQESADAVRKGFIEGLEGASKEITKGIAKGSLLYLVHTIAGPLAALASRYGLSFSIRQAAQLTSPLSVCNAIPRSPSGASATRPRLPGCRVPFRVGV